ncbi:class I SAM-dependent methyltransferase [Congregibacter litoralis]|uniref:Methylase involved in ubiquinone/menaquinone biosynthesis n=1 Tax=Congregibacter litoralis KT71 TaxID=314285 RepID=A4ABG2_9GAMM|nr:class I SAM-dependent methyltransferase [Congregibacter litoralis]EAQ96716.1 Methylase involved in ubiquinone/menaquinone biosynthesis [Congregibacter litoralis KT71]
MNNEEQIAYWNGDAGRKWAQRDAMMSRMLAPVADALMNHAAVDSARAVLDVGCGGGSETLMLAKRLGPEACVLGVDVSAPLLDVAREELARLGDAGKGVAFVEADASRHDFGDARFDLLFSRFGVMFFDDATAAFTHLRGALEPGGRLAFACWQALANNPWTALPLKAALSILPPPPTPKPGSPGPFAFADARYVETLLSDAGWQNIAVTPHEVSMDWEGSGGFEATARELVNTGPVGRLLVDVDENTREAVYAAAEEILAPYYQNMQLSLPGAVWLVTAENP